MRCLGSYLLVQAECEHSISPRAFKRICENPATRDVVTETLECKSNEKCFDRVLFDNSVWYPEGFRFTASCINDEDFMYVFKEGVEKPETLFVNHPIYQFFKNDASATEAIVTSLDGNDSLLATSLSITAQESSTMYNVQLWGSLPNGRRQCTNCASISLWPLPDATQRLRLDVKLPEGSNGGRIYFSESSILT